MADYQRLGEDGFNFIVYNFDYVREYIRNIF
jgi:hypothetical protein